MNHPATPADLEGQPIGPVEVAVTPERVALYVDVTGDDPVRWRDTAPPGFGSVLLFAVADEFLSDPRIVPFTSTLLHLEQSFTYLAPIDVGAVLTVTGTVARVRQRADSYFVTFTAEVSNGDSVVMESVSTFVLSNRKAPRPEEVFDEPPVHERGLNEGLLRSASRYDLVRYSGATRDFNPLHWDHDSALSAGLPGIVVHGLLMYAWLMQETVLVAGRRDVVSAKIRFRSALRPSQQAVISVEAESGAVKLSLSVGDEQLISGRATVASSRE